MSYERLSFFFFQAEDGIRDIGVTGVQTCALPISSHTSTAGAHPVCRPAPRIPRGAHAPGGTVARDTFAMAELIFSAITSLDGYIEDEAGTFDWAAPDDEVLSFLNDLERPIGTYLYGRRMYETMVYWETADVLRDQRSEEHTS